MIKFKSKKNKIRCKICNSKIKIADLEMYTVCQKIGFLKTEYLKAFDCPVCKQQNLTNTVFPRIKENKENTKATIDVYVENVKVENWRDKYINSNIDELKGYLPQYETERSAGADVRAFIENPITLQPLERCLVPTGLKIKMPNWIECQVRPRSGLANNFGISVLNTPGTVDEDYRGEIGVILINLSNEPYTVQPNERIGQLVFNEIKHANFIPSVISNDTERGEGGFGSTGTK